MDSPSVRRTEVEVDLGPSHRATVYYRAISETETDLGCAAFPTAAFGTATDPRRCYYSGFPWRRGHRNTAIPVDTCSTKRTVDPVPMANSGPRSVDTIREYAVWGTRSLKPTIFERYKIVLVFFCFLTRFSFVSYYVIIYLFSYRDDS